AISASYSTLVMPKVLGVTATPDRADMRNLGSYYDSLAYEYSLVQAIKEGYLCRIVAQTIPLQIDISGVGFSAGDYKAGELGTALDPYLDQIAREMQAYCKDRKTVVFLPLVATSQKFCDILNEAGFRAAEVNGNSEDRAQVLADFDAGKYNVLCNSMLLTEGWRLPICRLRHCPAGYKEPQPVQSNGRTRYAALPRQGRSAASRLPLEYGKARAVPSSMPHRRNGRRGQEDDGKAQRIRRANRPGSPGKRSGRRRRRRPRSRSGRKAGSHEEAQAETGRSAAV
ncbi:type III restriction protein res subunit, partial [Megasphaera sp. BL7]